MRRMTKWRVLSPSVQLMVDGASGARGIIRDTSADGAYRFYWSVIPSEESLPIAAGRTGGLARARSIAEAALRAYAADFQMHAEIASADGTVNLSDRVSGCRRLAVGIGVYCQPMLQISAQTRNFWVLEALCSAAVT
jgi:hypothetical protein